MEKENDVSGKIVLSQMVRYAKRVSDVTGCAASIDVRVVFNPELEKWNAASLSNTEFYIWDSSQGKFFRPLGEHNDLKKIGKLIDQLIETKEIKGT